MNEHTAEHEKKKSVQLNKIFYPLLLILIIFSIANAVIISDINAGVTNRISLKAEESRPANIAVIKLSVSGCPDCFDADNTLSALSQYNINITDERSVDISSDEGRQMIEKYGIKKVPALIVSGEINKSSIKDALAQYGELKADAVVYAASKPVYLDIDSGRIVGRVNATMIKDASCGECVNVSSVMNQIRQYGVSIENENALDASDTQAKTLIEKYKIEIIPTMLLSSDIEAYSDLITALRQIGTIEPDGTYILRAFSPPYRNLSSNEIAGKVTMINLVDSTCEKCYNVTVNRQILRTGYGLYIYNETTDDINSPAGKEFLNKYNITAVPNFLLSPEARLYSGLMQAWNGIGTVEKDGWLVFRTIKAIPKAVYKDLSTNQTVGVQ